MRWLVAFGGVVMVLVGAALTFWPFASLELLVIVMSGAFVVLAISELLSARATRSMPNVVAGLLWLVAAGLVVLIPGVTANALSLVAGITLIVNGAIRMIGVFRQRTGRRFEAACFGAAGFVLGLLCLVWPDITLLVIAELIALWIAITGWSLVLRAVSGTQAEVTEPDQAGGGRIRRYALPALALMSSVALAAASISLQAQVPRPDAFYSAPESASKVPGTLIRAEPFDAVLPAGSRGWRILYATSQSEGVPAIASAVVVVPDQPKTDLPVVAWAHGTTGITRGCAPSLTDSFATYGALPTLAVQQGWAVVATDYPGLGTAGPHPYLIGQGEGRSVLDAVRAAHQLSGLSLARSTVVWGHSQGGHAALWTGILAPTYAPEIDIRGIAALAPATELPELVGHLRSEQAGVILGAYLMVGYAANYPDVKTAYVRPVFQPLLYGIAARCTTNRSVLVSFAVSAMLNRQLWVRDPQTGPFGARLKDNVPAAKITMPVLMGQGLDDSVIPASVQTGYVTAQCALGTRLDYRAYPGLTHDSLVTNGSPLTPDLVNWTQGRFAGVAAAGCGAVNR